MGWPVDASHCRAVPSWLPVIDGLAVGAEGHGRDDISVLEDWLNADVQGRRPRGVPFRRCSR